MLQFQGSTDEGGFSGRDQKAYLRSSLFATVKSVRSKRVSATNGKAEGDIQ
jgi:hypothetical protein